MGYYIYTKCPGDTVSYRVITYNNALQFQSKPSSILLRYTEMLFSKIASNSLQKTMIVVIELSIWLKLHT